MFAALLPLLFVAMLFVAIGYHRQARRKKLAATASELGLRFTGRGRDELAGEIDGVPVWRSTHVVRRGKSSKSYTWYRAGGLPRGVTLARESLGQGLLKAFGAEDHLIGDAVVDASLVIKGDAATAQALFPVAARDAMAALLARDGEVSVRDGHLVWQVARDEYDAHSVGAGLHAVAEVAGAMRLPAGGAPERLADMVRHDPLPSVRRLVVKRLAEARRTDLHEHIRPALLDPDPRVRHAAATALDDGVALRALLDAPDLDAADRVSILARLADPALTHRAVGLLGHESPAVRVAAAHVVGATGTIEHVAVLHQVAEDGDDRGVRRAAKAAIRAIQARLHDADAGRIALAGPQQGGEVALASATEAVGRVAVAGESRSEEPRGPAAGAEAGAEGEEAGAAGAEAGAAGEEAGSAGRRAAQDRQRAR